MEYPIHPDAELVSAYVPIGARTAFSLLWQLDAICAHQALNATEPMLADIRLAWWRDQLVSETGAHGQPLLQEIAIEFSQSERQLIASLPEGWMAQSSSEGLEEYATSRAAALFGVIASRYAPEIASVTRAGAIWALVDAAKSMANKNAAEQTLSLAQAWLDTLPSRFKFPSTMKAFSILFGLAKRDLNAGNAPARFENPRRRTLAVLKIALFDR